MKCRFKQNVEKLSEGIQEMAHSASQAPIFIKDPNGVLHPIPYDLETLSITVEHRLVYMGKKVEEIF